MKIMSSQLFFVLSQPKLYAHFEILFSLFFKETIVILYFVYCYWQNTPAYLPTYLKESILFDKNSEKSVYYCLVVTHWKCQYIVWYELWKKCLLLFRSNSLKVSVLFDINSEESVLFGNNSLQVSVGPFYRSFVGGGGKVLFRYLNHVFHWQHISGMNANFKESMSGNKAFI